MESLTYNPSLVSMALLICPVPRAFLPRFIAGGISTRQNSINQSAGSDDVRHMLNALAALGVSYTLQPIVRVAKLSVTAVHYTQKCPGVVPRKRRNGNAPAGGSSCLGSNDIVLTGEPRMKERPMVIWWMRCAWAGRRSLTWNKKLSTIAFTGRLYWRQR